MVYQIECKLLFFLSRSLPSGLLLTFPSPYPDSPWLVRPECVLPFAASVTLLQLLLLVGTSHLLSVCGNLAHSSKYIVVKTLPENFPARGHLSCYSKASLPSPHYTEPCFSHFWFSASKKHRTRNQNNFSEIHDLLAASPWRKHFLSFSFPIPKIGIIKDEMKYKVCNRTL